MILRKLSTGGAGHPHVVRLYDVHETDKKTYMVADPPRPAKGTGQGGRESTPRGRAGGDPFPPAAGRQPALSWRAVCAEGRGLACCGGFEAATGRSREGPGGAGGAGDRPVTGQGPGGAGGAGDGPVTGL